MTGDEGQGSGPKKDLTDLLELPPLDPPASGDLLAEDLSAFEAPLESEPAPLAPPPEFATTEDPFAIAGADPLESVAAAAPIEASVMEPAQGSGFEEPFSTPPVGAEFAAPEAIPDTPPPESPLNSVRDYAERAPVGAPPVEVAYPFSLLIEGPLDPTEREKLTEFIKREGLGLSELELEPQFEARRVLIPRVSEYVGVLLVQMLRASRAELHLGPSERIFASPDSEDARDRGPATEARVQSRIHDPDARLPADRIPITPDSALPGLERFEVLDAITASAQLKSLAVEAEGSPEYEETIEALKRELRQKAFRRGAQAILNFSVSLTPLSQSSRYRVTVLGSAVRAPAPT